MASMIDDQAETIHDYIPPVKLKKTIENDDHNDLYCFECHTEGDVICCDSCSRVYHSKCLGLVTLPDGDWTCPECQIIQCTSMSAESSRTIWNHHSTQEFHTMLKFAIRRMKSHPQATPFLQPVDYEQIPEYLDYIIHPMDLQTIEKSIDLGKYTSTNAFLGDVKWIVHNSVVFNGNHSKITSIARSLLKIALHEMNEMEICSECYLRSAQPLSPDWFAEPCTIPHTLCWAKMRGYQPWPAKVLRIVNDDVDVRFFGQHDRAWVPINNCFILSKEYPGVEKKKSNVNFEKSLSELQMHIDHLKRLYGHFNYACPQTALSKTKPFKFVSIIDDSRVPSYVIAGTHQAALRSLNKCVKQARSPLPQMMNDTLSNEKSSIKRSNDNSIDEEEQSENVKRARVSSKPTDDNTNTNSNRIVLRIRKTSDDISSCRSEASTSSSSSHQITVHIKEPLTALREDDETGIDPHSHELSNDFDMLDHIESKSIAEKFDVDESCLNPESPIPMANACTDLSPKQAASSKVSSTIIINEDDIRSSIHGLLDAVDNLMPRSEVSSRTKSSIIPLPLDKPQFAERRTTTKHPRKALVQHRIMKPHAKSVITSSIPPASFDQIVNDESSPPPLVISTSSPSSASPSNITMPDEIPTSTTESLSERTIPIHSSIVKSEPLQKEPFIETPETTKPSTIQQIIPPTLSASPSSGRSFLISPPASHSISNKNKATPVLNQNNTTQFAPRIQSTVAQKTSRIPTTPVVSSTRQQPSVTQKRTTPNPLFPATAPRNNSNISSSNNRILPAHNSLPMQTFDGFNINSTLARRTNGIPVVTNTPPLSTRNPIRMPTNNPSTVRPQIEDTQPSNEIQAIIKGFNDKFHQLLADFSTKIEATLESNRLKYEKELEETRRSYRSSMNELRSVTTHQVQEMHRSLELQYWTRMNEMRNRYESALQQPINKNSKYFNGGSFR